MIYLNFFFSDYFFSPNKMMFPRRKFFLILLVGSLTSFLWVCYVVKNERETAVSRRRVMETTSVETNLSKGTGKSNLLPLG